MRTNKHKQKKKSNWSKRCWGLLLDSTATKKNVINVNSNICKRIKKIYLTRKKKCKYYQSLN